MAVLLPFAAAGSAVEHGVRERTPLYCMKRPFFPLPLTALRKRKSERERVEGGGASQLDGQEVRTRPRAKSAKLRARVGADRWMDGWVGTPRESEDQDVRGAEASCEERSWHQCEYWT